MHRQVLAVVCHERSEPRALSLSIFNRHVKNADQRPSAVEIIAADYLHVLYTASTVEHNHGSGYIHQANALMPDARA
jgi:hypothetical protein